MSDIPSKHAARKPLVDLRESIDQAIWNQSTTLNDLERKRKSLKADIDRLAQILPYPEYKSVSADLWNQFDSISARVAVLIGEIESLRRDRDEANDKIQALDAILMRFDDTNRVLNSTASNADDSPPSRVVDRELSHDSVHSDDGMPSNDADSSSEITADQLIAQMKDFLQSLRKESIDGQVVYRTTDRRIRIREIILEALAGDTPVKLEEIKNAVARHAPGLDHLPQAVSATLSNMISKGLVVRTGLATYALAGKQFTDKP